MQSAYHLLIVIDVVGSILPLLTSYALLTAQTPIDESTAQSTIKVVKKDRKDTSVEVPEAKAEEEQAPPPPPAQSAPIPRIAAPPPPAATPVRLAPTQVIQAERSRPIKVVPWITLGGSIAAVAVGVFFAVRTTKALAAQSDLEFEINTKKTEVSIPDEFTANQKSIFINGLVSTVLISAGVSGAIASTVALSN